ncbi:MAG: hypothetical protein ACQERN_02355 [Thermodesulfobacteriota bacterium]
MAFITAATACIMFVFGGLCGAMEHGRDNRASRPLAPPQNLRVINEKSREKSRPVGPEIRQEAGEQKTQKPRGDYGDDKGRNRRQKQEGPQRGQQQDRIQDKDRQQPEKHNGSGRKNGKGGVTQ